MNWRVELTVGGERRAMALEQDGVALMETPGGASGDDAATPSGALGVAQEMAFYQDGAGPSYDLRVQGERCAVMVTGLHVTATTFSHLPNMDAVAVVTGDAGVDISRRITLLALAPLREALSAGEQTLSADEIDLYNIQGAVNGIDLSAPGLKIWPLGEGPELGVAWNVPRANPSQACLRIVHVHDYQPAAPLARLGTWISAEIVFEEFWLIDLLADDDDAGLMQLTALGVGRDRRDFVLTLHTLRAADLETTLHATCREHRFKAQTLTRLKLRDNTGIKAHALLPDSRGLLVAIETPTRKRQLHRIDGLAGAAKHRPVEGPAKCRALRVLTDSPPAPSGIDDPAEDERDAADASPEGEVMVNPGGDTQVSLGAHPADAEVWAQVYIIGEGRGAALQWWIAQQEGTGDVPYTLHFDAARPVKARYIVFDSAP